MKTSEKGLNLIKKYEDLMLEAYKCPAGKWTIGYGHTNNVRPDDVITELHADELFKSDVRQFEISVSPLIKRPLTQNQYDAIISFVFNVGIGNFRRSTLLKKLNAKDDIGAAGEFKKWIYSKGKKLNGLIRRREEERQLFME